MSNINFTQSETDFISKLPIHITGAEGKGLNEYTPNALMGLAGACITAKKYDLARKLLTLSETKSDNHFDLHFTFNQWIELTYKQRADENMLNLCIDYCEKDIDMYDDFAKAHHARFPTHDGKLDIRIPAFERLAIIYEKQGKLDEAIKVCELAMSKNLADYHIVGFEKRRDKLLAKKQKQSK